MTMMRCLSLLLLLTCLEGKDLEYQASNLRGETLRRETLKLESEDTGDDDVDVSAKERDPDGTETTLQWKQWLHGLQQGMAIALTIYLVLMAVVGLLYASWPRHKPLPSELVRQHGQDFQYGLFDGWCHSCRICCLSFWCLPIRWAETATSSKDNFSAWGGRFLFCFLVHIYPFYVLDKIPTIFLLTTRPYSPQFFAWLGAQCVFHLVLIALQVMHRQHLRREFGLVHGTCHSLAGDVMTWCFCCPCATMQEALQVEYVGEAVEISAHKKVAGV